MHPPIWLASASPRRRQLLAAAGIDARLRPAGVDDGRLRPARGVSPRHWVAAMAHLKAAWVVRALRSEDPRARGTVLGADTVCVHDDSMLGKPVDVDDARRMLRAMASGTHLTMTGVALLGLDDANRRLLFVDATIVRVGHLDTDAVEAYLESGAWRDKAGAYNLDERVAAGWDIRCEGDPATVMGLPMRRLEPLFARIGGA